ncbi:FAD-dependent oxidoreductase [uncultured Pigmentiphaga sp.]|uniref:NAD(P)/FAD-dependent oxidoreductase n=1 Tax=uncultured Pigmentiphaga sp. TaxID=340361 RepID=UPI00262E0C39|nr:FAD-dependent oxidoreductase [uncultured Pigmentiphaga sp.]
MNAHLGNVLIIGAGHAGASAARELRRLGYDRQITLVSDESHLPYERPALSKGILQGTGQLDKIALFGPDELAALDITFRPDYRVTELDVKRRRVCDTRGDWLSFDACLIATGGRPRVLPTLPPDAKGVHYLRTLEDALRLRDALTRVQSVLVVGAGYLGLEVASSAAALGRQVHIVDTASHPLSRSAPMILGQWLHQRCSKAGIQTMLGNGIASISLEGDHYIATLDNHSKIFADIIIIAVGQEPNIELAKAAGLSLDALNGGILVDALCTTSETGIYAAGDCVSQRHPWYGNRIRLESWQSANEQGCTAAAAMLGLHPAPRGVPWFWTDMLDCNIQILGTARGTVLSYTTRGSLVAEAERPKFLLLGMENDRLVQVIAVNAGGDLRLLRNLVGTDTPVDARILADEGIPLKSTVRELQASTNERR